jgi:hypothetical protein
MQGAQKAEPRGVSLHTLSGAVCSATQQMSVFQLPLLQFHTELINLLRRSNRIVAVKAGQAETIFGQAGGLDHAFHC